MSDASPQDFKDFLNHRFKELSVSAAQAREKNLAAMGKRGLSNSGAAILSGVQNLEEVLRSHVAEIIEITADWSGANLQMPEAREIAVAHLQQVVDELAIPPYAFRHGSAKINDSQREALEQMVGTVRSNIGVQIRAFALGVGSRKSREDRAIYVVNADTIIGGVQQGNGQASQSTVVTLTSKEISAALDRLENSIPNEEIRRVAEPDIQTIKSQLQKLEPNPTILQEAGKSLRTIIEGAVGGAAGGVATPGLLHALGAFSAILGIG